jgi:hypothetical protein
VRLKSPSSIFFTAIFFAMLLLASCRDNERDNDTNTFTATESALAEQLLSEIIRIVHPFSVADSLFLDSNFRTSLPTLCPSQTIKMSTNDGIFPMVLDLNFGKNPGDICGDGSFKNGKIKATYTSPFNQQRSLLTIQLDSLILGKNLILGSIKLRHSILADSSKLTYEVLDLKIQNDTLKFTYNASRNLLWHKGLMLRVATDDHMWVSGKSSGRSTKGSSFENEIEKALYFTHNCNYFTEGNFKHRVGNLTTRNVQVQGGNACDNKFIVQIAGRNYPFAYYKP